MTANEKKEQQHRANPYMGFALQKQGKDESNGDHLNQRELYRDR